MTLEKDQLSRFLWRKTIAYECIRARADASVHAQFMVSGSYYLLLLCSLSTEVLF